MRIVSYINTFKGYAKTVKGIHPLWLLILFLKDYLTYGCTIRDFFIYKFYFLNRYGKKLFYTGMEQIKFYNKINHPEEAKILKSKEETFIVYQEFMRRDFCGVKYHATREDYATFLSKHKHFFVKPITGCSGHDVRLITTYTGDANSLWEECHKNNEMLEEVIHQHKQMAELHPDSLNTIRVMTLNGEILGAIVRIGTGGNCVDNAHSGGIFAQIDTQTGIIISKGVTHSGAEYYHHPDTGVRLLGFEIPLWEDILSVVHAASQICKSIPIIGFDIAVSTDGPVLVEVNEQPGFDLLQQHMTVQLRSKIKIDEINKLRGKK